MIRRFPNRIAAKGSGCGVMRYARSCRCRHANWLIFGRGVKLPSAKRGTPICTPPAIASNSPGGRSKKRLINAKKYLRGTRPTYARPATSPILALCPLGTFDNSPPIYRWDSGRIRRQATRGRKIFVLGSPCGQRICLPRRPRRARRNQRTKRLMPSFSLVLLNW